MEEHRTIRDQANRFVAECVGSKDKSYYVSVCSSSAEVQRCPLRSTARWLQPL